MKTHTESVKSSHKPLKILSSSRVNLQFLLFVFFFLTGWSVYGHGSENAIAAGVMAAILLFSIVITDLIIFIMFLIRRKRWQHWFIIAGGALMLIFSVYCPVEHTPGRLPDNSALLAMFLIGITQLFAASLIKTKSKNQA
jgi:hypothetical protein